MRVTPTVTRAPAAPARLDHAARRGRLSAALSDRGLDALLVTDLLNIRYLTGFTGSNAALLVAGAESRQPTVFCTDGRYVTQAAAEVPDLPTVIERSSALALLITARGRVGFEAAHVSVAAHAVLVSATSGELTPTAEMVEDFRAIKDDTEIALLRQACTVADTALDELIAAGGIRAGRSEREVGLDLDHRMRMLGAEDPAFETIVASGANSAIPHHRPSGAELATGDLVVLDFGARVQGYHSDMTRTLVLGRPARWQREIFDLVLAAQRAGREACVVGATGGEVDAAARSLISDGGYGEAFGHGLGHGVGLEVHEAPSLARAAAGIIRSNMCLTVEPGIYLPGRGGVRIEDSGVVRGPDGPGHPEPAYQVLTTTPRELVEL